MLRESLMPPAASARPSRSRDAARTAALPTVVLLLLVQWRAGAVPWGLSRLVLGPRALGVVPGLRFARVLGSGRDGGFGVRPGLDRQGLVGFFDDEASARAFAQSSRTVHAYRAHAQELLLVVLKPTSCRGSWAGVSLAAQPRAQDGPVASLTRASIRWRHARRFWAHASAAQASVAQAPGCRLAVGLGEAPLVRQATFSLWHNAAAMDAYARSGAHRAAIEGAWREGWFGESMFVRFEVTSIEGSWHGKTFDA